MQHFQQNAATPRRTRHLYHTGQSLWQNSTQNAYKNPCKTAPARIVQIRATPAASSCYSTKQFRRNRKIVSAQAVVQSLFSPLRD
jgi:hypothetical protein